MTVHSSVFSRVSAAVSDSRLIGIVRRLFTSMNAPPEQQSPQTIDDDAAALRSLAGGSVLAARVTGVIGSGLEASSDSLALKRAAAARESLTKLDGWQRIRAAGIAGLVAAGVNVAVTPVDPSPASGYRWFLWGVFVLASIGCVLAPRPLATAIRDSRTRRLLP